MASVSCIYGLGAPEDYLDLRVTLDVDMEISREKVLEKFVNIQYSRNDTDFHRVVSRLAGTAALVQGRGVPDDAIRVRRRLDRMVSPRRASPSS